METLDNLVIEYVCNFLTEKYGHDYTYEGFKHDDIKIYAFSKTNCKEKLCIVRIGVRKESKQIYIPNILTPPLLKHNGVGKKIIRLIYELGALSGYEVFVVNLTDGFRDRLMIRGALKTAQYDILQIVGSTKLIDARS